MSSFNLANHAVLVAFNVTRPKLSKVDKDLTAEQKVNHGVSGKKTIRTVKDFYGDELSAVEQAINLARKDHYAMTLSWVSDGVQLLPSKMYMQYTSKMREHKKAIDAIVQGLDFQQIIARRAVALNGTFNRDDYPTEQAFKESYTVAINISPVPDSSTFNSITEMVDCEVSMLIAENEKRMVDASQAAMKSIWEKLYKVVQHVAETLKDGKASIISETLIGNVCDLVNILPMLNVTDDAALNDLSDRLKQTVCNVSSSSLKKNELRQKEVGAAAQNILDVMSSYMGAF